MLTFRISFESLEHSTLVSVCLFPGVSSRALLDNVEGSQDRIRRFHSSTSADVPFSSLFFFFFRLELLGEVYMRLKLNTLHQKSKVFPCIFPSEFCHCPRIQDSHEPGYNRIDRLRSSPPHRSCAISFCVFVQIISRGQRLTNVPVRRDTEVKANIMW